ncbi:MAG: hypothetical protein WBX01_13860, partial [Nitrososphaeraceae archaeon]
FCKFLEQNMNVNVNYRIRCLMRQVSMPLYPSLSLQLFLEFLVRYPLLYILVVYHETSAITIEEDSQALSPYSMFKFSVSPVEIEKKKTKLI